MADEGRGERSRRENLTMNFFTFCDFFFNRVNVLTLRERERVFSKNAYLPSNN